jgi:DNA repair ATPase RecN
MSDEEGAALHDAAQALSNLREMTDHVRPQLTKGKGTFLTNALATMENLRSSSSTLEGYITEKDKLPAILDSVSQASASLLGLLGRLNTLVEKNAPNVDMATDYMASAAANLDATTKELRRNPWRAFYQPKEAEARSAALYEATRTFSEAATQLNLAAAKLEALESIETKDEEVRKQIRLVRQQLQDSFKKYQKFEQELWERMQERPQ